MKAPEPVVIDGVLWKPYSVNHIDAGGKKFSFYIFAISREHAACVVEDIRETAWRAWKAGVHTVMNTR